MGGEKFRKFSQFVGVCVCGGGRILLNATGDENFEKYNLTSPLQLAPKSI